jgi:hypothetical protein
MTASEFFSDLQTMGPQSLRVLFMQLADQVPYATTNDGNSLRTPSDLRKWLLELSAAAREAEKALYAGSREDAA